MVSFFVGKSENYEQSRLIETTSLPRWRLGIKVELGTAPLVLDMRSDLLAKKAVKVITAGLIVVVDSTRVGVCIERPTMGLALMAVVAWSLWLVLLMMVVMVAVVL